MKKISLVIIIILTSALGYLQINSKKKIIYEGTSIPSVKTIDSNTAGGTIVNISITVTINSTTYNATEIRTQNFLAKNTTSF